MRLYWELARRGYRRYAAYPAATWAGAFTNTVFGFLRAYVLLAVLRHRPEVAGYDEADVVTYAWLTQGMIMTIYLWRWFDLVLRIRSGDVAIDLARPVDLQRSLLAFDLGRAFYHLVYRGIPPFLVGALVFDVRVPADASTWALFLVSVVLAVVVSFGFRFLWSLSTFWLTDYRGVAIAATTVATFFSGFLVPVSFFPGWLEAVARALPFWAFVQAPVDVFLGHGDALAEMGLQAAWAAALLLLGRGVLGLATRRVVVQGG